jgi:hypothetical protein
MSKVTNECRDKIVEKIESILDTRDKRFMFLKIAFPRLVLRIQLEGSAHETAYSIYFEFEKQGMIGSLVAHLNNYFDCELDLVTNG